MDTEEVKEALSRLKKEAEKALTEKEARLIISKIAQITRVYQITNSVGLPTSPAEQAAELSDDFRLRTHIHYLSDRIAEAVKDVERGVSRKIVVSLPPRSGKSTLLSLYSPLWLLRRHPEWKIVMAAHDGGLTSGWAREQRQIIERKPNLGIALRPDGGAYSKWETVEGGGMYATSIRGALTGRGAKVLIIDDPVKDFVEAHSLASRDTLWNWWLSVAQTRLEGPSLVLVVMTRWHEDDFVGRLYSDDYEGRKSDWEQIVLPAIAEPDDVLGRAEGEPLISPLNDETPEEALARWHNVKSSVGNYTFAAMYQQRPAPAKGAIFDESWWHFWTTDPRRVVAGDNRVVYLDPETDLLEATWLDSWDCAFKGKVAESDFVVGQRWARKQANRYLIAQQRQRMTFTETLTAMERWAQPDNPIQSPCGHLVHQRLIEDAANGPAIIDVLKDKISGIKSVTPRSSKESRSRAVTPEIESGNVYLPHPGDPGNEWVNDLMSELRNFPNDAHDDQVDALTQALHALRGSGRGSVTVPRRGIPRASASALATTSIRRSLGR